MATFEEELSRTGYLVYTNKGVSMMPLLRQDRDVMVIRAQKTGFQKNDAVLFKRGNGQYVLHRITKKLPDGKYFIIGDNCVSGETVPEGQILGVLTQVRRDGKTVNITDHGYKLYIHTVPARRVLLKAKTAVRTGAVHFVNNRLPTPVKKKLKTVYHAIRK